MRDDPLGAPPDIDGGNHGASPPARGALPLPQRVLRLLAAAGLTVEQVFGGFDGRPLDAGAEDLIWIARAD